MRRVHVHRDQEIYPATIVEEHVDGFLEVADSIWERYLAAVAEMEAVTALLEDLDEVDHQRNRCTSWHDGTRCGGRSVHSGPHWGYPSGGRPGMARWVTWDDPAPDDP